MTSRSQSTAQPRIRRLDETTVNRIAAGEIIHRPANALKELLENSLDAGSTSIQVTVKDGGLKLLQIHDNGHGISKDDLAIVCERFTTSKLARYEDLERIQTFGFRGEALASISHVAHLSIVTRTSDSPCSWKAHYSDGRLVPAKPGGSSDPKPCAGNVGTQITVQDLFYNDANRRRTLSPSAADEYTRILDVVQRYAVHNNNVAFTCRKQTASGSTSSSSAHMPDLQTSPVTCPTRTDTIRAIYGTTIARELLDFSTNSSRWNYTVSSLVTNANFNTKKFVFLLFINHRLVDHALLKRSIESVYAKYLPKHTHPFVYMHVSVPPETLDVNVHPTKRVVQFMNEDIIISEICESLEQRLLQGNASRVYYVQTMLSTESSVPVFTVKPRTTSGLVDLDRQGNDLASTVLENAKSRFGVKAAAAVAAASGGAGSVGDPSSSRDGSESDPKRDLAPNSLDSTDLLITESQERPKVMGVYKSINGISLAKSKSGNAMRPPEHRLVRTDDRTRTLDAYIIPATSSSQSSTVRVRQLVETNASDVVGDDADAVTKRARVDNLDDDDDFEPSSIPVGEPRHASDLAAAAEKPDNHDQNTPPIATGSAQSSSSSQFNTEPFTRISGRDYIDVQLTSILELRAELIDPRNYHKPLTDLFREHIFVGTVTSHIALIQHHTKLYLVNYQDVSRDFFYQVVLRGFSNFGVIQLTSDGSQNSGTGGLRVRDLVMVALDSGVDDQGNAVYDPKTMPPKTSIAESVHNTLVTNRAMLQEYFSIDINEDGRVCGLPVLLRGYVPNMDKLPEFMLRLGGHVEWNDEKPCFRTLAEEIAVFYEFEPPMLDRDIVDTDPLDQTDNDTVSSTDPDTKSFVACTPNPVHPLIHEYRRQVEHVLFPALKRHLIAPKSLLTDRSVVLLADLPDLYKVFERC